MVANLETLQSLYEQARDKHRRLLSELYEQVILVEVLRDTLDRTIKEAPKVEMTAQDAFIEADINAQTEEIKKV
jgi:arginine deiminase